MEKGENKRRIAVWALAAAVLAGAILGGALLYRNFAARKTESCRILEAFAGREQTELSVSVSARLAGKALNGEFSLFRTPTADGAFWGGSWDGMALYQKDDIFYLPTGQTFRLSTPLPQGDKLLEQTRLVLSTAKVTRTAEGGETVFRAEAPVQEAKTILSLLSPETAEKISVVDSLTITLRAAEGELSALTLEAAGSGGGQPYQGNLTLTVLAPGTLDTAIPGAVQTAAKAPGEPVVLRWNPDVLPLLRGVWALAEKNDFQAALTVALDCGALSTAETLDLRYSAADGIGRLAGRRLELYFSGSKLCTSRGTPLTEYAEISPAQIAALALPLLVDGRVAALHSGDDGVYTLPLTAEELNTLAAALSAQLAGVRLTLSDGSTEARVTGNRLTDVTFACTGSVPFLTTTLSAGVRLTLTPSGNPQPLPIPEAVRQALG